MANIVLIGIAAGLMAAALFASAALGGGPARAVFALVASLPIATLGLARGYVAASIAGVSGALALALGLSPHLALAFALTQALPLVVLVYLAGLSRVGDAGQLEWYPPGRIVVWSAALATVVAAGVLVLLGTDMDSIKTAVRAFVEAFAAQQLQEISGGRALTPQQMDDLTEIALALLPAAMGISVMGTLLVNLWVGGRIARAANVLERPWPDLATTTFPRGTPLLLAAATLGTFMSGMPGLFFSALFGAMFLAYVLLGLAVIHYVTRGHPWRTLALWGIYGGLIVFNTVASLLVAILGLVDTMRPLRDPPPSPDDSEGPAPPHT